MALLVPEYLQTQKYSAKRDRLTLAHGGPVQAGAWDLNDFKVIQRALGANMTVDVMAGSALIPANDPGNAGLYHDVNDAPLLGTTVAAAHATLPRIDSVYVQVLDTTDGGDASDGIQIVCATGTATSGTTLDSRAGAPNLPTGALLLADILVPAASTSVITANIRDRRTMARGQRAIVTIAAATTTTTLATFSGDFGASTVLIDAASGVSGQPVGNWSILAFSIDTVGIGVGRGGYLGTSQANMNLNAHEMTGVSAGYHTISLIVSQSISWTYTNRALWIVEYPGVTTTESRT